MSLHKDYDNNPSFFDLKHDEDIDDVDHKRHVRKMLEDRLERKRLKAELDDELEGEFDWDDLDR